MKKLIVIIVVLVCFSCQEKQVINPCSEIEKKYDSILSLNEGYESTSIYKFYNILIKETGTALDSLLIKDYKNLEGKDSLINIYVWDRIHTINQNITKLNVYEEFRGTYLLQPNHNKKYAQATKVIIDNDSCYIYKYKSLIISDKFKLINSSDKFVKGKLRLNRYKIRLLDFSSKAVILDDNLCMDCEQLQFYKTK